VPDVVVVWRKVQEGKWVHCDNKAVTYGFRYQRGVNKTETLTLL
jgi:hypothetical protein